MQKTFCTDEDAHLAMVTGAVDAAKFYAAMRDASRGESETS